MKAKHIIGVMMQVFQAEELSVKVAMRDLRKAGLLTTGARGVNAPDMTTRDLARVTLAFIAHEKPGARGAELASKLRQIEGYRADTGETPELTLEALTGLAPPFTFEDALAALIEVYALHRNSEPYQNAQRRLCDGTAEPPRCTVEIMQDHDVSARITLAQFDGTAALYEFQRLVPAREAMAREATPPPRHAVHWIDQRTIIPIAAEFARTSEARTLTDA